MQQIFVQKLYGFTFREVVVQDTGIALSSGHGFILKEGGTEDSVCVFAGKGKIKFQLDLECEGDGEYGCQCQYDQPD